MRVGGGADVNHLHVRIREQFPVIRVDASGPELLGHRLGAFGLDVADGDQVDAFMGGVARQMRLLGPCMRTDDADAQLCLAHGNAFPISFDIGFEFIDSCGTRAVGARPRFHRSSGRAARSAARRHRPDFRIRSACRSNARTSDGRLR